NGAKSSNKSGTTSAGLGEWDDGEDETPIGPRAWLYGNQFCRTFLSCLIGEGAVGKTALRIAQLLCCATGRPLLGEHVFGRSRVLLICLEDDRDELRRRVRACKKHYGISNAETRGWLYLATPKGLKLAELDDKKLVVGVLDKLVRDAVVRLK